MLFSSEQVSNGHPDKICDQISDAIVTDILHHDPRARIAAETIIKDFEITIMGEVMAGGNVIVDGGFVIVTLAATA